MNETPESIPVTPDSENPGLARLRARVRAQWRELSPAEQSVCRLLTAHSAEQILFSSAQELGGASGTSNASVIRTLRRLGYSGLPALKQEIAAPFSSSVPPEDRLRQRIDRLGDDLTGIWERVFDEARDRLEHCRQLVEPHALKRGVELLAGSREVATYGVGASGIAARHLALKLNRIGLRSRHIASDGFRLADDLLPLARGDTAVVFAPGRMLHDVEVLLGRCRAVGASSVLVSDELAAELGEHVDVTVASPHTPTGMTAEALSGLVVADALVQAVATVDPDRAVETSHELTALRGELGYAAS